MQKLKKVLKNLTKLAKKPKSSAAAKPAKKATAVKKKSAPAPAKKKATAKKAAPAPKKATGKVAAKAPAPAPKKATGKVAAAKPAAAPAPKKATGKVAAAKSATPAPTEKKATEKKEPAKKAAKVERVDEQDTDLLEAAPQEPTAPDAVKEAEEEDDEIYLTDAEGRRYCRVRDCDQSSAVDGYCRYHYLLLWKKIQVRKKILTEGKLERYIEDLTARYPDKYLEMLKKDLRNEKDFLAAIQELEIDDSGGENEFEEEAQSYLDEVRGISSESGGDTDRDEY